MGRNKALKNQNQRPAKGQQQEVNMIIFDSSSDLLITAADAAVSSIMMTHADIGTLGVARHVVGSLAQPGGAVRMDGPSWRVPRRQPGVYASRGAAWHGKIRACNAQAVRPQPVRPVNAAGNN